MLTHRQQELWDTYVEAERDRIRSVSMPALDAFLDELERSPLQDWSDWALGVAQRRVDDKDPFPVRFPLFTRALFPVLLRGIKTGTPGCARWLAGFTDLVYHREELGRAIAGIAESKQELLRLALKHDPGDSLARARLIDATRSHLEYTIHELPAGVLYDANSASAQQCTELQEELAEFERLARDHGSLEEHKDLIAECRFHYAQYPQYLAAHERYGSYGRFLELREEGQAESVD